MAFAGLGLKRVLIGHHEVAQTVNTVAQNSPCESECLNLRHSR